MVSLLLVASVAAAQYPGGVTSYYSLPAVAAAPYSISSPYATGGMQQVDSIFRQAEGITMIVKNVLENIPAVWAKHAASINFAITIPAKKDATRALANDLLDVIFDNIEKGIAPAPFAGIVVA